MPDRDRPHVRLGTTTLGRIEGKLFEPVPRQGKRQMRVFTPEQVEVLQEEFGRRPG